MDTKDFYDYYELPRELENIIEEYASFLLPHSFYVELYDIIRRYCRTRLRFEDIDNISFRFAVDNFIEKEYDRIMKDLNITQRPIQFNMIYGGIGWTSSWVITDAFMLNDPDEDYPTCLNCDGTILRGIMPETILDSKHTERMSEELTIIFARYYNEIDYLRILVF